MRSMLRGWRSGMRLRFRLVLISGIVAFLGLVPVDGFTWFGLALAGMSFAYVGLTALVALASRKYAEQWLEVETPDGMPYQLALTGVLLLGGGAGMMLKSYIMWLGLHW